MSRLGRYRLMPVWYTDSLPEGVGGRCKGFFSLIRPKYREDQGLHEHEYTHFKQFFLYGLWIHNLLYSRSSDYRLHAELDAYRAQLKHSPKNASLFASFIATRYRLKIGTIEALMLLQEP